MQSININYDETTSVANQIVAKGTEFTELLNRIKNANSNLKTYWEGTDASKYATAVETQTVTMQRLSEVIEDTGNFIKKAAEAYREAMETNASGIKN